VAAALLMSGCGPAASSAAPSAAPSPPAPTTPDPSPYAVSCLAVGAANDPAQAFAQVQQTLGPLPIRRSFDSSLPASFNRSAAAGDAAVGVRSFVSWKPPGGDHAGVAAGRYDRQIRHWAKSVPRTGVWATAWHEPENDMTAAEYVAFARRVYAVAKTANPTIHFGAVYMAYWWDPAEASHYVGDPAAWWPGDGYADFAALDWYGVDPTPMSTSASFTTWYQTMEPTGVPLLIAEYGQGTAGGDAARELARAQAITQDAAWISVHPRIRMWLYWQASGAQGDWRLLDPVSRAAWVAVAASGCRG
jgi:hypothetical protein